MKNLTMKRLRPLSKQFSKACFANKKYQKLQIHTDYHFDLLLTRELSQVYPAFGHATYLAQMFLHLK